MCLILCRVLRGSMLITTEGFSMLSSKRFILLNSKEQTISRLRG